MAQLMGKGETYQQKAKTKKGAGKKTERNLEKASNAVKGLYKSKKLWYALGGQ